MARFTDIKIRMAIDSIVKVRCINDDCVFNSSKGYLADDFDMGCCLLKYIEIHEDNKCGNYEKQDDV